MIFFVTGASGSGKSACMPLVAEALPGVELHDFDDVGVPTDADTAWRQRTTEHWLCIGLENERAGLDTMICGGAILGEILACPSTPLAAGIAVCLLDCDDTTRQLRLKSRAGEIGDQIGWAAWQRAHAGDPSWRPDVIVEGGAPGMHWQRWSDWKRGDPRWARALKAGNG